MPTPITWADTVLCIDADVVAEESNALDWAAPESVLDHWRELAKEQIGERLRRSLKDVEISTDAAEVLDLIGNPGVLKTPAVFFTLHKLCKDRTRAAGDMYDRKAEIYFGFWEKAYGEALAMLNLDTDEDGTIQTTEKYNAPTGVRLRHGG
jgi:hypothetical protein